MYLYIAHVTWLNNRIQALPVCYRKDRWRLVVFLVATVSLEVLVELLGEVAGAVVTLEVEVLVLLLGEVAGAVVGVMAVDVGAVGVVGVVPTKHSLQHVGNRHTIEGCAPPQSANKLIKTPDALFRNAHTVLGMVPCSSVRCSSSSTNCDSSPIFGMAGTVPLIGLPSKYKACKRGG